MSDISALIAALNEGSGGRETRIKAAMELSRLLVRAEKAEQMAVEFEEQLDLYRGKALKEQGQ